MRRVLFFLLIAACGKDAAPVAAKETPAASTPELALPLPLPEGGVVAQPPASAVATASAVAAKQSVPATGAAKGGASPSAATAVTPTAAPQSVPQPAATKITGSHFTLDVASPGCVSGSACVVTVRLEANGGFHINKDYPYKLALNAAPNVEFLGSDPASSSTFSKSAGDFVINEEHVSTMTARFKPTAPGTANVSGVYKMSVCSESNCQLEQMKIALDVPVQPVR